MMKNIAASVLARLQSLPRATDSDYELLLIRYVTERLLYRLSLSTWSDQFVLKGARLFAIWTDVLPRATRDLDLLGFGTPSISAMERIFQTICMAPIPEPDGVVFVADKVTGSHIREEARYIGVRIMTEYQIGRAHGPIQIDIGYGDAVVPTPHAVVLPTLLDFPSPRLKVYARETVIAEKFEAMVTLGLMNSRMKDFYDIWVLARSFAFDGETLCQALTATFARRGIPLPAAPPMALTANFSSDPSKRAQWRAFIRKGHLLEQPVELSEVTAVIAAFLLPPVFALSTGSAFSCCWTPENRWQ